MIKNHVINIVCVASLLSAPLWGSLTVEEDFPYRPPTERFLEKETWPKVCRGLRAQELSREHKAFFDALIQKEDVGFTGYHGSTQEFRIYQDIIRGVLEEIVEIPIRSDFYFFRIPGDPSFYHESLEEYGSYLNDYDPSYFICLNYAAYSNYKNDFFSSYYYFATNSSSSEVNFEEKLNLLFDKLGIERNAIHDLYSIGRSHLKESPTGVIYQLFDLSHKEGKMKPYALIDPLTGTFAHNDMPFSEAIQGTQPSHFYLQTRLLMSNRYTLNPHAPLSIQRYDRIDPKVTKKYEMEMKKYMAQLKADPSKVDSYKKELFALWEHFE